MAFCKKCGTKLDEDAVFCPECGTPVSRTKKDKSAQTQDTKPETPSGTILNAENVYGRINLEKLPEGHIIDDRYKIVRKLGQGSFGAVYLAYDNHMEIQKALKIIPEAVTNDKEAMLSLKKEASIMVKLNHPNIVRVYDFHYDSEIKYIDMEYVDGISLADLKLEKKDKKFPEEEVKKYALQIAEGLNYAHNQRVIHKDIKPQNVMLTKDGIIKLMDFGIAETVHSSMSRLKNTGSSGTLVYMSPEQLRGKDVGRESDIYSLGATLYELLTGNPPFYQGDITFQIINEDPKSITGVSQQMNEILIKCLRKEIGQRFKNCEEFIRRFNLKELPKEEDDKTTTDVSLLPESLSKSQEKRNNNLNQFTGNRKVTSQRFNILTFIFLTAKIFILYGLMTLFSNVNANHIPVVVAITIFISIMFVFLLVVNYFEYILKNNKSAKWIRKIIIKTSIEIGLLSATFALTLTLLTTKIIPQGWRDAQINILFTLIWALFLLVMTLLVYKKERKAQNSGDETISLTRRLWKGKSKTQKKKIIIYSAVGFGVLLIGMGLYVNSLKIKELRADRNTLPFYGGVVKLRWKTNTKNVKLSVHPYMPGFPKKITGDSTTIYIPPLNNDNVYSDYGNFDSVFEIKIGTGRIRELFGMSKTLAVRIMPMKRHVLKGARYGFSEPTAIAVDNKNNIWIANYRGKSVTMIPQEDTSAYPITLSGKQYGIAWPDAIAVDKHNNIWIGRNDGLTVIPRGDPAAKPVLLKSDRYEYPYAIAVDKHNNIWLAEYDEVSMIPKGETPANAVIFKNKQHYGFNDVEAIAADKQNNIWVVNKKGNSITTFSGNDTTSNPIIIGAQYGGFNNPDAIAIDTNNNVWVTNYDGESVTVIPKGDPWSKPVILKGKPYSFDNPTAIAIDGHNNVWIINSLNNNITLIPNGDTSATPINIYVQGSYYLDAIAVDKHNNIWMADKSGTVSVIELGEK